MIPVRLIAAYRAALYRVAAGDGVIDLRPDRPDRRLDRLLRRHRATTAALITACNPRSRRQPPLVNALRTRRLAEAVRRGGWRAVPTAGTDPAGCWPPEPGLLVLGIGRAAADRLAASFGQNGYLWLAAGRPPRLALCRPARPCTAHGNR